MKVVHSYQAESDAELDLSVGDFVVVRKVLVESCAFISAFSCWECYPMKVENKLMLIQDVEKRFIEEFLFIDRL